MFVPFVVRNLVSLKLPYSYLLMDHFYTLQGTFLKNTFGFMMKSFMMIQVSLLKNRLHEIHLLEPHRPCGASAVQVHVSELKQKQ